MRTRGKGFKKEIYLSICSMHKEFDENCEICKVGWWQNIIKLKLSGLIYDVCPFIWRWWVNRKH